MQACRSRSPRPLRRTTCDSADGLTRRARMRRAVALRKDPRGSQTAAANVIVGRNYLACIPEPEHWLGRAKSGVKPDRSRLFEQQGDDAGSPLDLRFDS